MKLPRGVSGRRVVKALERLGYVAGHQKGSHLRMRHQGPPTHSVSVPMHASVKTGTLHDILVEVAHMRAISIESLAQML